MALITELDDRTLVEQHRAGDEQAFRRIVERHHRSLYANALRRLHDRALAEDAVQEAFLRAFRALPRFDGEYHLDAWLHRILTNVCHDLGRRQGRDTRLFDRVSGEHDVAAPPADIGFEGVPREQLETALGSLPANYREVLLLRFVDELSYSDVALKAGISEENARARVSRGRSMLRRMLSSASAALIWAIPPLRRNDLTAGNTEVANQVAGQAQHLSAASNVAATAGSSASAVGQVAPAVSQSASVLGQASTLVAQAAPTIAQAAPAVTSSAPAIGKTAMAVGLAASVAIPAGVAVDRQLDKPEPAVAAPAPDVEAPPAPGDPVEAPTAGTAGDPSSGSGLTGGVSDDLVDTTSTTVVDDVESLDSGTGGAVGADLGDSAGPTAEGDDERDTGADPSPSSTTTVAPAEPTPTTSPPTTEASTGDGGEPPAQETPPPADLRADALTVVEAGPRLELDGEITLTVDGETATGTLSGKVLVGDADPKDPEAPREVEGDLVLRFSDGVIADLRIRGQVAVSSDGRITNHDLAVVFRLDGGAEIGLAESGDLTGSLQTRDGAGALWLVLPAAPGDGAADA